MLKSPPDRLVAAVRRFSAASRPRGRESIVDITLGSSRIQLPSFTSGDRKFIFATATDSSVTLKQIADTIRVARADMVGDDDVLELCLGVAGTARGDVEPMKAGLGVRVETLHGAIGRLILLPDSWRQAQLHSVQQTLQPVLFGNESKAVDLRANLSGGSASESMIGWISSFLSWDRRESGRIAYLRAEAGKGKSTTLADFTYSRLSDVSGPLPLFIRLRGLERGTGISWAGIAERLGVLEAEASRLAEAVRAGLVILLLDGLDEVSGRHNPTIVQQVVKLVTDELLTPYSLLAISGRTTEGAFFHAKSTIEVGLELPEVSEPEFADYVSMVISRIVPEWEGVAQRLPEPLQDAVYIATGIRSPVSDSEKELLREWLCAVFDGLGKDRSLFFIQSLACIGRNKQLAGNQPLIIGAKVFSTPSTYDVCSLAASLACVREQDKIDEAAKTIFTPSLQLELITIFALLSSAEAEHRAQLPSPNELVRRVFRIDTTHQNEEFSAIIHQMQKHALLYSRRGDGATAGDWRPTFLSEWIRCTLLVRAWNQRHQLGEFVGGADRIELLVARAEQAQLAYRDVWPSIDSSNEEILALFRALEKHASAGSPEAASNFWSLFATILPDTRTDVSVPSELPPLSDFAGAEFSGVQFGKEFSGSYVVLNDVQFSNCEFRDCHFTESEFTASQFRNCRFWNVHFIQCQGGALFDGCHFEGCTFLQTRSQQEPAWEFVDCRFDRGCKIEQDEMISSESYLKSCIFADSITVEPIDTLLRGEGLGFDRFHIQGIEHESKATSKSPTIQCLRTLLKTFFPTRAGERQRQARRYIRLSAIGRGNMPVGAPNNAQLIQLLEAEGFTSGGREAHVYAPWSQVAGGGPKAIALRNELMEFMDHGKHGPTVKIMLDKIKRWATW